MALKVLIYVDDVVCIYAPVISFRQLLDIGIDLDHNAKISCHIDALPAEALENMTAEVLCSFDTAFKASVYQAIVDLRGHFSESFPPPGAQTYHSRVCVCVHYYIFLEGLDEAPG